MKDSLKEKFISTGVELSDGFGELLQLTRTKPS